MDIFNQYSYILISAAVLLASAILMRRYFSDQRIIITAMFSLATLSVAGLLLLRPGAGDVSNLSMAEATIGNGRPTFLEFFSNYCAGCLAIRPIVDRYAAELGDQFNILRVDIHTEVGRILRERYTFTYTPEFILFDSQGNEVWRGHTPPPDDQLAQALSQRVGTENP
jgi:thiol-disulfide isomerase/thioredoxin